MIADALAALDEGKQGAGLSLDDGGNAVLGVEPVVGPEDIHEFRAWRGLRDGMLREQVRLYGLAVVRRQRFVVDQNLGDGAAESGSCGVAGAEHQTG